MSSSRRIICRSEVFNEGIKRKKEKQMLENIKQEIEAFRQKLGAFISGDANLVADLHTHALETLRGLHDALAKLEDTLHSYVHDAVQTALAEIQVRVAKLEEHLQPGQAPGESPAPQQEKTAAEEPSAPPEDKPTKQDDPQPEQQG
jgi:ABC-type phosphate transport system auxiliary subunit